MLVNKISSHYIDSYRRTIERVTYFGKYNGINIAIDNLNHKGKTIQKRFVTWGDSWQRIVNKIRNRDGKFEKMGNWIDLRG